MKRAALFCLDVRRLKRKRPRVGRAPGSFIAYPRSTSGVDWQARYIIQDKDGWRAQLSQGAICLLPRDKLGSVDAHFRSRTMMTVKPPPSLRTSSPTNTPGASHNTGGRGHSNRRNCRSSLDSHSIRSRHTAPRNSRDRSRHNNMAQRARLRSGLRRQLHPRPSPNLPLRHASHRAIRPNRHRATRPPPATPSAEANF